VNIKRIISILLLTGILISGLPFLSFADGVNEIPVLKLTDEFGMIEAEECLMGEGYTLLEAEGASEGKVLKPTMWVDDGPSAQKRFEENGVDDIALYIDVETEAYYTIWVRFDFPLASHGNVIAHVGDNFTFKQFDNNERYTWNSVETAKFKKGRHLIGIQPRRLDVYPDKILITSSEYYAPSGMGEKPSEFRLGKEGANMSKLYFPLPPYTPKNEHPRLYMNKESIPEIKKNLTHPQNIKAWERVKKIAASDMNCRMADGYYSFSYEVQEYLECCAFMYAMDNEANLSYGKKAVSGLKDYLTTVSYSGNDIEFARSGIVFNIAKVYDWCYPLLTKEDKELVIKKGLAMAGKLETGWPPIKLSAFNSNHGGEGGLQVESLAFALATYEDYPDIWNSVAGRYFAEFIPINNFWYDVTSFQGEGDSYGKSRFAYESKGNTIIEKMGLGNLISENERFVSYNQIYRKRPDGNFMMDGDIWDITFTPGKSYLGDKSALLYLSQRYKDPYLKYELYKMTKDGLENKGQDSTASSVDFLILNDVDLEVRSHKELPLTIYTGEGHNLITARTGWDDGLSSKSMVVSMKGGGRMRGDHMHLDNGNFTIYYKGPLAIDSGVYNGLPFIDENGQMVTNVHSTSYHCINYQHQTVAHNCILVHDPDELSKVPNKSIYQGELNSGGQIKGRYSDGDFTTYENATSDNKIMATRLGVDYGPDMNKPLYSYIKTDITNAYTDKMKEYTRGMMFLNLFDDTYPGALIVFDKVTTSNPNFKKSWLLHSQEEPAVNGQTTVIERTEYGYNGRLVNESILPKAEDSVTEKIGGEGKEYMIGDKNIKAVNVTRGDESGKWRIEISPKTPKETDYFLNVLHVSDADDSIAPLPCEYYETEGYAGVKIKDRVVFLTKNSERTSKKVEIYAKGEEENLHYIVDGLNSGRWGVYDKSGKKLAYSDVTKEGGIAYFTLKAGEYTLIKERGYNIIPSKDFNVLNATVPVSEIPVKLSYNTLYQHFDKGEEIVKANKTVYLPFEKMLNIMDTEAVYEKNGDRINVTFEDVKYVFELNSKEVTAGDKKLTVENPPEQINGISYVPLELLHTVFKKNTYFDTFANIVWIDNPFQRAKDFIVNSSAEDRIQIKDATGKDYYVDYKPYMAHDGDVGTPAGSNVIGAELIYEFKETENLKKVQIMWNNADKRDYHYKFYVSEDGINYTLGAEGQTGFTGGYTDYEINKKARFFKIVNCGNTVNDWISILEMKFIRE